MSFVRNSRPKEANGLNFLPIEPFMGCVSPVTTYLFIRSVVLSQLQSFVEEKNNAYFRFVHFSSENFVLMCDRHDFRRNHHNVFTDI